LARSVAASAAASTSGAKSIVPDDGRAVRLDDERGGERVRVRPAVQVRRRRLGAAVGVGQAAGGEQPVELLGHEEQRRQRGGVQRLVGRGCCRGPAAG
jgi:hypothetical protein